MNKIVLVLIILGICFSGTDAFAIIGIDDYTALMLHCDGADGSTDFADDSFSNHTVTAYGHAQIDTAEKKFGTASGLFDGNGDYLDIPDSDDWYFDGDLTIDFWVRFNSLQSTMYFVEQYDEIDGSQWAFSYSDVFNRIRFFMTDGINYTLYWRTPWKPSVDTWYHLAVVRSEMGWYCFIDGESKTLTYAYDTESIPFENLSGPLYIGLNWYQSFLNGNLDELRISKDIARWTSDFTPATEEYTVISELSSLLLLGFGLLPLFKRRS